MAPRLFWPGPHTDIYTAVSIHFFPTVLVAFEKPTRSNVFTVRTVSVLPTSVENNKSKLFQSTYPDTYYGLSVACRSNRRGTYVFRPSYSGILQSTEVT